MMTPQKEHRFVTALCNRLVPGGKPVMVPLRPEPGAEIDNCFQEVALKIKRCGGAIQHGWTIWELPGLFIEGEFHGVWVSPSGEFIDVTPKRDNENEIMFLPDPTQVFDENSPEVRDNVRMPILDHPIIHAFIQHAEAFTAFKNAGTDPASPRLHIVDRKRCDWFEARKKELERAIRAIKPGRNDMCRCGSAEKFKKCCGRT